MYAAIDVDSKFLLDIEIFGRRGADPAAAFLHRLIEKHNVSNAEFLVDGNSYLTALSIGPERSTRISNPKPHRKLSRFEYLNPV